MFVLDNYSKMVFRKDNEFGTFYQIGLSKKDRNNNYINGYMQVRFKKGVSVPNMTKIVIKNAFIDFYLDKNNKTVPYIMVLEFETVEEQKQEVKKEEGIDVFKEFGEVVTVKDYTDDLLPF
jgi:hypothetical protein